MVKLKIKPLSVNKAWKGKRYKTDEYKNYETAVLHLLPAGNINKNSKLYVNMEFGFSSRGNDADNPVKPFFDILQKKYGINDSNIYGYAVEKRIVKKGEEYIKLSISQYGTFLSMFYR